jgi:hypothetical protein
MVSLFDLEQRHVTEQLTRKCPPEEGIASPIVTPSSSRSVACRYQRGSSSHHHPVATEAPNDPPARSTRHISDTAA